MTDFLVFKIESVSVDALGLWLVIAVDITVPAVVVFSQSLSVGFCDVAATSCGVLDDVSSKLVAGGSLWVLASCVGVGGLVWVPVSSLGVFRGRGGSRSSVWMPFVSRTAATVKHWGPCPSAVHFLCSSVLANAYNELYVFLAHARSSSAPSIYPSFQLFSAFVFHSL